MGKGKILKIIFKKKDLKGIDLTRDKIGKKQLRRREASKRI